MPSDRHGSFDGTCGSGETRRETKLSKVSRTQGNELSEEDSIAYFYPGRRMRSVGRR
jgi:hypothetical protein